MSQVYVGTDRGLVLWNGTNLTNVGIPVMLRTLPVWAILRDRDANIWIGSERGLIRLNSRGAVGSQAGRRPGGRSPLCSKTVRATYGPEARIELLRIQESPFATYHSPISRRLGPRAVRSMKILAVESGSLLSAAFLATSTIPWSADILYQLVP